MYSAEGEEVKLSFSIYPSSNVEDWLLEVEHSMKASVHDIIEMAIKAYPVVSAAFLLSLQRAPSSVLSTPARNEEGRVRVGSTWVTLLMLSFQMTRTEWVLNWPGQVTIAGCQTYWTMEVAEALEAGNISSKLFPQLSKQVELKRIGAPHTPTPHTRKRPKFRSAEQIRLAAPARGDLREGSETRQVPLL